MNLPPLADAFIPLLKQNKLKTKREKEDKYQAIMLSLYNDLLEAEKEVKKSKIQCEVSTNSSEKINLPHNTRYFPKSIRDYIKNTPYSLFKFKCKLNGSDVHINFYSYTTSIKKPYLEEKVKKMLLWLAVCKKYAHKKCSESMNVTIYLTPFKKILPENNTTVLSAEHVNTAFTFACEPEGEITIFREEEWFKVFLHESFHSYGLDFALSESTILRKTIEKVFHIKSDFNVNEAYTETWARIINCALFSFDNKDKEQFLLYVEFCLQLERLFSLFQMNKILKFMGLDYTDLYEKNGAYLKQHLYKEDTHVFGYYVLTAIFLNDYKGFIQWCSSNNVSGSNNVVDNDTSIMKFNCSEENLIKIGDYITSMYRSTDLIKTIESLLNIASVTTNSSLLTTTRMAIIDNT